MSDVAIRVEKLSKEYRIGGSAPGGYRTLRESITDMMAGPFRRLSDVKRPEKRKAEPFWALRDLTFTIAPGEAVGIIGRNGAGKSTLLKILSRITDPTSGFAEIHGRVGSLLEVGTGFHPELSGRENVFLNGAILGMRRTEIARKFDEIIAFSEVEKFIDMPVKHYSSGMYLRLAFAVAAHLEPEILLIDEVLAVGDAGFRKKSLGKMDDVAHSGRTIFLVSHDLAAIHDLCPTTILLEKGRLVAHGPTSDVIAQYMGNYDEVSSQYIPTAAQQGDGDFRLLGLRVHDGDGHAKPVYTWDDDIYVDMDYRLLAPVENVRVGFQVENERGGIVFRTGDTDWLAELGGRRSPGVYRSTCRIPRQLLNKGTYFISTRCDLRQLLFVHRQDAIVRFDVTQVSIPGGDYHGQIRPNLEWQHAVDPVGDWAV